MLFRSAAPVDGAANEALIRVLARRLGVAKVALTIVSGKTSKAKVVRIEGIAEAEVQRRLGTTAPGTGLDDADDPLDAAAEDAPRTPR